MVNLAHSENSLSGPPYGERFSSNYANRLQTMKLTSRYLAGLAMVLFAPNFVWAANKIVEHPATQPQVLNNFVTQLITAEDLAGDVHE